MSVKTGNSYAPGTTTDSVKILTASPRFSTMSRRKKVTPSDFDNDRQPEMAIVVLGINLAITDSPSLMQSFDVIKNP